jgi:hypothetical protein
VPEPHIPYAIRAQLIADDLRRITQAARNEWRAERPVYRVEPQQEVKPLITRAEWPWLVATGSTAVALGALGIWKLTEIIGGVL